MKTVNFTFDDTTAANAQAAATALRSHTQQYTQLNKIL